MSREQCNTPIKRARIVGRLMVVVTLATLAGCRQDAVRVYRVAKEPGPKTAVTLPAGWEEAPPGEMRVASYRVRGADGQAAEVSVIPLPGLAGHDLDNVNRWRGQVSQPPINENELMKLAQPVEIAGEPAQLYDQAGTSSGSGEKTRILAAILHRDGVAWFFKMTGDDQLVLGQKPAFLQYLKGFSFPDASDQGTPELPPSHPPIGGESVPGTAPVSSNDGKPEWEVPTGWQEVDAGGFLVAKFLVGESDSQAAVNVSISGGGLVANVNRWRGQLGLGDLSEVDVNKLATSVDIPGGKAMFVEMAGTDAKTGKKVRLIGAMVSRVSQTWFYKIMGPESVVTAQKSAFLKFVQTAKYPQ